MMNLWTCSEVVYSEECRRTTSICTFIHIVFAYTNDKNSESFKFIYTHVLHFYMHTHMLHKLGKIYIVNTACWNNTVK